METDCIHWSYQSMSPSLFRDCRFIRDSTLPNTEVSPYKIFMIQNDYNERTIHH